MSRMTGLGKLGFPNFEVDYRAISLPERTFLLLGRHGYADPKAPQGEGIGLLRNSLRHQFGIGSRQKVHNRHTEGFVYLIKLECPRRCWPRFSRCRLQDGRGQCPVT
jgi:hypothetical protein